MLDPEEGEGDMPADKDSLRSVVGNADAEGDVVADMLTDGDGDVYGDEEEDSNDEFSDGGEGAVVPDRPSLRAASESGRSESGSGTEDDPDDPVTPSAGGNTPT
jgi:hypothetical protein